jgi:hypothetical protein
MDRKEELIEKIIGLEWKMFQKVENIGGKSLCQEDPKTFEIMRSGQFESWSEPVLESYWNDLKAADEKGMNLVAEKYGRMMESTSPAEYAGIAQLIPPLDDDALQLIDKIVRIMLEWKEETAREYPSGLLESRPLYSSLDTPTSTSFETYLRGELSTYSGKTLHLYYDYLLNEKSRNRNLSKVVLESVVKKYGYPSLEEAERALKRKK